MTQFLRMWSPRRRQSHKLARIESLEARTLMSGVSPKTVAQLPKNIAARTIPAKYAAAQAGRATSITATLTQPIVPYSSTFALNSRASASKTIYLDFDGHTTSGTSWNSTFTGGADIVTPAFDLDGDESTFSQVELLAIQEIWARVAEDFAPFDVNVTTQDPGLANLIRSGAGDTRWGKRIVNGGTQADWLKIPGVVGIATLNSFASSTDVPVFNFTDDQFGVLLDMADTASHEVGHALGLTHDGTASLGYYPGHGTGALAWAPIMGAGFGVPVSQWSKGEYPGANNKEDDFAVIASAANGFGFRADDYGNSRFTASQLATKKVGTTRTVNTSGVIGSSSDLDWFSFSTTGGTVSFNFAGAAAGGNLDIRATLYDANGLPLLTSDVTGALFTSFTTNLPAGSYYIEVDGVGAGSLSTGYSDYGSVGNYTITGSIPDTSSGTATGGTSVISGRVVSDANADGLVNGSDAGISGVLVFIDLDGNGAFNAAVDKSARTDSQGNFKFTGLLGGTYQIYQTVPSGWQQISLGGQPIFVATNSTTSNVLFRNLRPPVLSSMSSAVSYKAGSAAILLAPSANVTDADTTSFTGARLNVSLTQNGDPTDVLSIRNQGNAAGQVGFFGGVVRYSGVVIGSVSGGISGSDLVITFNSSANLTSIKAVLRNLTFVSTSPSTSKAIRTVSYSLSDGKGGISSLVSNQVKVT
ncbi:MAG TPA: SdrD B-like domain-containing protein [Caulifigura sp.]|nr:SdrD B-like domain-containing protein [Caulifigura sp.]